MSDEPSAPNPEHVDFIREAQAKIEREPGETDAPLYQRDVFEMPMPASDIDFGPDYLRGPGEPKALSIEQRRARARDLFAAIRDPDDPRPRARLMTPSPPIVESSMTDAAHAEKFCETFLDDIRYDFRLERWLIFDGTYWRPDRDGAMERLGLQFCRMRQQHAIELKDRKERDKAFQYFMGKESKKGLHDLVDMARWVNRTVADNGDHWDERPDLLCTMTGIVDLRTGVQRAGQPDDRITQCVAVGYDETAVAPRWSRFVNEIFDGDTELIDFVQRYVGYAISGRISEQCLCLFYGTGANGKGTFMNSLSAVLGDYAYNMPFSTIDLHQRSPIPHDLAVLEKKRFVISSETNEGTRLNEGRIKALTGGDPITARFLHHEFFTFTPVAKFILAVNHKPIVRDDSYGFWRRMRMVPFLKSFVGDNRDDHLGAALADEAPGILRWAIEGAVRWYDSKLTLPASVSAATSAYEEESDPLAEFFSDCIEPSPGHEESATAIYALYAKWANARGMTKQERLTAKVLGGMLSRKVEKRHTMRGVAYVGIRLRTGSFFS